MFASPRRVLGTTLAVAAVGAVLAAPSGAHKTSSPHSHGVGKPPAGWTGPQWAALHAAGRVNVQLGPNVVLSNVKIGHAAQIAAYACGTKVGPQAAKVAQVEKTGVQAVLCTTPYGDVTIVDVDPPATPPAT